MLGLSRARHCLEIIARSLFLICRRSRRSLMTCRCKTARHAAVHGSAGENERQPRRSAVFATVRFLRLDSCENGSLCSSCKICEKYVGESELSMRKPQISEMTNICIYYTILRTYYNSYVHKSRIGQQSSIGLWVVITFYSVRQQNYERSRTSSKSMHSKNSPTIPNTSNFTASLCSLAR